MIRIAPEISFLGVMTPSLQPGGMGPLTDMGYMVPQPFAAGGNRSYLKFWAVIGDLWYLCILPRQL
jgi:hypothetical protein